MYTRKRSEGDNSMKKEEIKEKVLEEKTENVISAVINRLVDVSCESYKKEISELKEMYKNDTYKLVEKIQDVYSELGMIFELALELPETEEKYIFEHIISGLYKQFHENRIEKIEGISCSYDKASFIEAMTIKSIKDGVHYSLYDDYSKVEHMKDKEKYKNKRAFWSPESIKDTKEAMELFWNWYDTPTK